MALDYLAAVLKEEGWRVNVVDLDIEDIQRYTDCLRAKDLKLIGITAMSIQIDAANELARMAREIAPGAVLLRGGSHDTYAYSETCTTHRDLYDAVVVGESEVTLRRIARAIVTDMWHKQREQINGLAYWDGEVKFTGPAERMAIDESIPWRVNHDPSYDFDVLGYKKTAQIMAARGCTNACFYCSESVAPQGRHELRRSIESLTKELSRLRQAGYEALYFDDPTFTRNREWVLSLCEEIKRFGFSWGCNTRVDCLDDDIVKQMRANGCEYLFCGLESAVPEILSAINKTSEPAKYLESAKRSYDILRRHSLPCSAFLIFGCPRREGINGEVIFSQETDRDIHTSLDFSINELDPDYLSMNILRLLPGVPLSFAPQYACIRPTGDEPIHGGYYDQAWYAKHRLQDIRSYHPMFRAFEGCGSVNPPHMTPSRCYEILSLAVDMVNNKNAKPQAQQTKIVVDPRFKQHLIEIWRGKTLQYNLHPFHTIELAADH